jgi:hypothetical protein
MEAVYVLGDNTVELPQLLKFGHSVMSSIWLHLHTRDIPKTLPGEPPCLRIADELLVSKILGVVFRPDATGTPEIGYAGFGADACSGEDNELLRRNDELGDGLDVIFRLAVHIFYPLSKGCIGPLSVASALLN